MLDCSSAAVESKISHGSTGQSPKHPPLLDVSVAFAITEQARIQQLGKEVATANPPTVSLSEDRVNVGLYHCR